MKDEGTYQRLIARCTEEGECVIWPGSPNPNGAMYVSIGGKKKLVRRALWEAKYGEIPDNRNIGVHCKTPACVEHLVARTVSQVRKLASKKFSNRIDYKIKMARAKAPYRKFSDEAIAAVREAPKGQVEATARAQGMSDTYARLVRAGEFRVNYSNPFAGLGA